MRSQPKTIIGQSPVLSAALDHLSTLASIDRPVLVIGERGTGKELAAERLHFLSPRWSNAFLKVNCGAIAETLLESELFGHEAGAFTGATRQHIGRFERADGGTLFLDELGTMSLQLQEKLLRLIEYGEFERVGGQKTIHVDVRIVAATNADLPAMADRGDFRWDLLDRLTFDVVRLPALRERPEDIDELANHFAMKFTSELGWDVFSGFSDTALESLKGHDWPGNIRELKNVVERSLYRWGAQEAPVGIVVIDPFSEFIGTQSEQAPQRKSPHHSDTPTTYAEQLHEQTSPSLPIDLRRWLHNAENDWLTRALTANNFSQKLAAQALALSYDQIRNLVKKHGINPKLSRSKD